MNEWMTNYINYDALTSNEIILCCYFSSSHDKKFSQILCLVPLLFCGVYFIVLFVLSVFCCTNQ